MGGNDDRGLRWITVGDSKPYLTAEDTEGFAEGSFRTASGSDRIIFHLSFSIFHLPLSDGSTVDSKCHCLRSLSLADSCSAIAKLKFVRSSLARTKRFQVFFRK